MIWSTHDAKPWINDAICLTLVFSDAPEAAPDAAGAAAVVHVDVLAGRSVDLTLNSTLPCFNLLLCRFSHLKMD